jgi:hypothetical protein
MSNVLNEQALSWSTTTPLAANASYTGDWFRIFYVPSPFNVEIPYFTPAGRYVVGLAAADQTGTIFMDFSNDGTTTHFSESFPVLADIADGTTFRREITAPWVRPRFVNGATPQGAFSLTAIIVSAY